MTSKYFAGACRHTWRRHVCREKRRTWPFLRGLEWGGWLTYFDGEWRAPRKCHSGAQSKQKQASSESGFKTGKTWRPAELSVTVETSAPHHSDEFVNLPSQVPPSLSHDNLGPLSSMAHMKSQAFPQVMVDIVMQKWTNINSWKILHILLTLQMKNNSKVIETMK